MKKTKLLMPILATTVVASGALPIVSCGDYNNPAEDKAPVSILNVSDETYGLQLNCDVKEATLNQELVLPITWASPSNNAYYVNIAVVIIGETVIGELSEEEQNGFWLTDHTENGVTIHIPGAVVTTTEKIQVIVDMEESSFQEGIAVNNYHESYIEHVSTGKVYDVITSSGDISAASPDPTEFIAVHRDETVQILFDLSKYEGNLDPQAPLYLAMGVWSYNGENWNYDAKKVNLGRSGELYYGTNGTKLNANFDSSTDTYWIMPPDNIGWGAEGQRKTIHFWYKFKSNHTSYFQIMVGQEHQD